MGQKKQRKNNIKADVIILGCSLPGIVAAHKLKKKFGDTMDIVVLDLTHPQEHTPTLAGSADLHFSKFNVVFREEDDDDEVDPPQLDKDKDYQKIDQVAKYYLAKFTKEFSLPIPETIISPTKDTSSLYKLFQYRNGSSVRIQSVTSNVFHDFDYLNYIERFELNQYQSLLDRSMKDLFKKRYGLLQSEQKKLLSYDQTTMEQHITTNLLLPTPREIMRTTVRLVCGASPTDVSVLFYLHQCHRTRSCRNHLDGDNTRFREKLLGHCLQHLALKLQQSIADITTSVTPIKEIRTNAEEQVILETMIGDNNYVCSLLAMAVRPDQLHEIKLKNSLLSEEDLAVTNAMMQGRAKKFLIQYADNFWNKEGLSGDILSIRGPILWAMERPRMSSTGRLEKCAGLIGYLKVQKSGDTDSKDAVVQQLIDLFGEEAANPVSYGETDIGDVFIPRCGDYVALRKLTVGDTSRYLEWAALDIFADGDVAAALEAGHMAYLHLLSYLRPQAVRYEDCIERYVSRIDDDKDFYNLLKYTNIATCIRWATYATALAVAVSLVRSYMRR